MITKVRKGIAVLCAAVLFAGSLSVNNMSNVNKVYAAGGTAYTVTADNVSVLGKSFIRDNVLTFSYANSGVEINFEGSEISADIVVGQDNNSPQKIAVFLDGDEEPENANMITLTGNGEYKLADNLQFGKHTVTVRKVDRGYYGFLAAKTIGIKSIKLGADGKLLGKSEKKKLSIEVFGDSITNGDALLPNDNGSSESYSWMGYVGEVARYFDADLKSCGISGNGLLRSVLSDENGIYFNLFTPQNNWSVIDESANGQEKYDHKKNPADVVIINLGTNDNAAFSAGQISTNDFYTEYIRLIREIHTDCPDAIVVATLGAMGADGLFDPIRRAVNDANKEAGNTYAYFSQLPNCGTIEKGKGYDNSHPSRKAHKIYGNQLIGVIEPALIQKGKWEKNAEVRNESKNVVGEMFMPKSISPSSAKSLIDDSGMSGLEAPNHMHASFDSNDSASAAMISANMYSSSDKTPIVIDLGQKEALGEMYIWNYNDIRHLDYGMKRIKVEYSQDGTNYTAAGEYTLGKGARSDDTNYGGNVSCSVNGEKSVDFNGNTGRYVRITPITNYGGSKYGLSEVRIFRHKTEPVEGDCITIDAFAPYQLDNTTVINAFNNSGMSQLNDNVTAKETHSNNANDMALLRGEGNDSMLILNLDGNYPISNMKIWNYNDASNLNVGVKEMDIYYTTDAPCNIITHSNEQIAAGQKDYIDWTRGSWKRLGTYTVKKGTGDSKMDESLSIDLSGIRAQHIKIVPKSNYGGTANVYGLSEVKVYVGAGWASEYSREWTGILSSSGEFAYQGNSVADDKASSLRTNNNGRGWIGGDGIHSVRLNGEQTVGSADVNSKTLFTFQDSFEGNFGNYDGFGNYQGYATKDNSGFSIGMRNMAYMMLTGDEPDVRNVRFYMTLDDGISDTIGGNIYPGRYWLGDSTVLDNKVYTFANKFEGLSITGCDFYESALSNNGWPSMKTIPSIKYASVDSTTQAKYHEAIYEEGNYIYLYGKKDNKLVVSRTTADDYTSLNRIQYWNGSTWVSNANEAAAISDFMPGNEFNVTKIETGTFAGKYMLVHTVFSITGATYYAIADSPMGPFVQPDDGQIYWSTEKYKLHMRYYSDDSVIFQQWNYNAKAHPAISKDGELLITYHFGIHDDQENRVPAYGWFNAVGKEYEHPTMIKMFDIPEASIPFEPTTISINGCQINTRIEGFRTVYTVNSPSDDVTEVGLIYGLVDDTKPEDMVIGSTDMKVYHFAATEKGVMPVRFSGGENSTSYSMAMELIKSPDFYNSEMMVRAYAKLEDGSITYSDVKKTSVFYVADILYQNNKMNTKDDHDYLYREILSTANPYYKEIDYSWNGPITK